MAAAVPFAIKAGTMIGGSLLGKKLSGPSKAQSTAMQGTQQAGQQLGSMVPGLMKTGNQLVGQGQGYLGNAGDYYNRILSNKFSAQQALAPEMANALEYYRGAAGKTGRNLRGGTRDLALAELDRSKVGTLAGMLPAARQQAAAGASAIGSDLLSGGLSATGQGANTAANAAYINSGLFNQATQLRGQEAEGGKAWGNILYDVAQSIPWGKKPASTQPPGVSGGILGNKPVYTGGSWIHR